MTTGRINQVNIECFLSFQHHSVEIHPPKDTKTKEIDTSYQINKHKFALINQKTCIVFLYRKYTNIYIFYANALSNLSIKKSNSHSKLFFFTKNTFLQLNNAQLIHLVFVCKDKLKCEFTM